jgi:hypothetical protein
MDRRAVEALRGLDLSIINGLIGFKKLRSSPKDLEDIKYLKALKEEG